METKCAKNNDKLIYQRDPDNYYTPKIYITESGSLSINVGGLVFTKTIEAWHKLAKKMDKIKRDLQLRKEKRNYSNDGIKEEIDMIEESINKENRHTFGGAKLPDLTHGPFAGYEEENKKYFNNKIDDSIPRKKYEPPKIIKLNKVESHNFVVIARGKVKQKQKIEKTTRFDIGNIFPKFNMNINLISMDSSLRKQPAQVEYHRSKSFIQAMSVLASKCGEDFYYEKMDPKNWEYK